MSGGASSLLVLPAEGISLEEKQAVNKALLRSGAAIGEMNTVRKHLSAIKGGRLAAMCAPARVVTLLISDVPGDAPETIGSGPTVPDPTTCADTLAILARHGIEIPPAARAGLESGRSSRETRRPRSTAIGPPIATRCSHCMPPGRRRDAGCGACVSDEMEGESREFGSGHAALARQRAQGEPFAKQCVCVGGETTVPLRNKSGARPRQRFMPVARSRAGEPGSGSSKTTPTDRRRRGERRRDRHADTLARGDAAGAKERESRPHDATCIRHGRRTRRTGSTYPRQRLRALMIADASGRLRPLRIDPPHAAPAQLVDDHAAVALPAAASFAVAVRRCRAKRAASPRFAHEVQARRRPQLLSFASNS